MRSIVCAALFSTASLSALAASCESLSSLQLPDTKIPLAQTIASGGFAPSFAHSSSNSTRHLPSSVWPRAR